MLARRLIHAAVIVGAFANAVPARAEFHPVKFVRDPVQDDLMGSGYEIEQAPSARAAKREAPDRKIALTWRRLAKQLRWLASFVEAGEGKDLLARAEDYEARAKQIEDQRES